jgi:hypothetical protein
MMRSLVLLLVAFCGFAQAILRKQDEGTEDAPPAASMRELKARLEDRLASQERELGVGPRGESSVSSYDSKKGSKKISRNGSKKVHYDDIELSFMIVSSTHNVFFVAASIHLTDSFLLPVVSK